MYTLDTCIDIQPVCAFIGSFKSFDILDHWFDKVNKSISSDFLLEVKITFFLLFVLISNTQKSVWSFKLIFDWNNNWKIHQNIILAQFLLYSLIPNTLFFGKFRFITCLGLSSLKTSFWLRTNISRSRVVCSWNRAFIGSRLSCWHKLCWLGHVAYFFDNGPKMNWFCVYRTDSLHEVEQEKGRVWVKD